MAWWLAPRPGPPTASMLPFLAASQTALMDGLQASEQQDQPGIFPS